MFRLLRNFAPITAFMSGSILVASNQKPVSQKPILQKPRNNIHRFLIIGETGCGKSTLVNALTNYYLDGELTNPKISIPTKFYPETNVQFDRDYIVSNNENKNENTDETDKNKNKKKGGVWKSLTGSWKNKPSSGKQNHSESNIFNRSVAQTQKATEYKFLLDDNQYCIVDTPGLNDTSGHDQDDKNIQTIIDSAINANELSGIVLILNGTEARITPNIKALINRFRGILPDSIVKNIIVVFTMCRPDTCNTDIECFNDLGITPSEIIYINNTSFSSDPKTWSEPSKKMLALEWDDSMEQCKNITEVVSSMSPVSTNEFTRIKTIQAQIRSTIHQTKLDIINLQKIQDEFEKLNTEFEKSQMTAEQYKDYTIQKTVPQQTLVPATYYSTICKKCNIVCHDDCSLSYDREGNTTDFGSCMCMNNGKCTVCKDSCTPSSHYHDHKKMETITVTVDEILEDIKQKFVDAQTLSSKLTTDMSDKDIIRKGIESKIATINDSIKKDCSELKQICSGFNLVDELNDLIHQLQAESKSLTSVEARQTADDFINSIKTIANNLN